MSRRSGQGGYVERKGNAFYVRFRIDVPGREKRAYRSVRICPAFGPGKMTKPEREHRAKQIISESGADTEEHFKSVEAVNLGVTFKQQAGWFMAHAQTRKRRPIKPATTKSWDNCINKWLNPHIGAAPLSGVNNPLLRELVSKMDDAGLSAKSIHNYIQLAKMVVASAVNEHGEEIYPRKWNHEFMDLPLVKNQRTPTFSADEVTMIVAAAQGQYRVLYAFLAGTGLRIGEAMGLEVSDISADGLMVTIRQSVWNGKTQAPKTPSALREVDLHSSLAAMLKAFIGERKSGFVFQYAGRAIVSQSSILKRSLHPILKQIGKKNAGFHSFRRYRVTHLRKNRVPEDLLRFWIGHAAKSVTDVYSMVKDDIAFRQACAANIGIGFQLPAENRIENPMLHPNAPSCTQTVLLSKAS